MDNLDTQPVDFRTVFPRGHTIKFNEYPLVLTCRNIDFGHVYWPNGIFYESSNTIALVTHIIDNTIDIDAHDNSNHLYHTLFTRIVTSNVEHTIKHMFNTKGICCNSFNKMLKYEWMNLPYRHLYRRSKDLIIYLTKISLNRFTKFYNTEKYHYVIHTMLLIMKAHRSATTQLPSTIIKHLIIPFIYQ